MQNLDAANDCFVSDERRLGHDEALAFIRASAAPAVGTEQVPLEGAVGRIVAETILSPVPVPRHTNAAVDGFAFAFGDYDNAAGSTLSERGRAAAGHAMKGSLAQGSCARIFTGAVIPANADTVAMQEDCRPQGGEVYIPPGLKKWANVRQAGEDLAQFAKLFDPGDLLRAQDLAAMASIGMADIRCFGRLRVGVVASGDEIVPADASAASIGHVHDANTPMLKALLRSTGADVHSLGIWPDNAELIKQKLTNACATYDLVITTGGASRGDEDHMANALTALGTRHFWQIAVKPGRPMMFGQVPAGDRTCTIAGLPGNPVAVFICTLMYVFPLIRQMSGGKWHEPRRYALPAAFSFTNRKKGRREFWRGTLVETAAGLQVQKFNRDGSGLITGLRAADGLVDIREAAGDVAAGDPVDFIPLTEFGILR